MTSEAYERGDPYDLGAGHLEVLRLVAAGFKDEEIAGKLKLSIQTVQSRIGTVLQKTLSASRTEAAIKAIKAGFAVAFFMVLSFAAAPVGRHQNLSSNGITGCEQRNVIVGEKRVPSSTAVLKRLTSENRDCAAEHVPVQRLAGRERLTAQPKAH